MAKIKVLYDYYDSNLGYGNLSTFDRHVVEDIGGFPGLLESIFSNYEVEYIKSKEAGNVTGWVYPIYINNLWFLNSITQIKKILPKQVKNNLSNGKLVVVVFEPISDFKMFSKIAGLYERDVIFITQNHSEYDNIVYSEMAKPWRDLGIVSGSLDTTQLSNYNKRKFSCFNTWYHEDKFRVSFVSAIEKMNLLDDFFLTLYNCGKEFKDWVEFYEDLPSSLSFNSSNKVFHSLDIIEAFEKSLLNIFFEASHVLYDNNPILTEKASRCFAHKMPFIAFSHQNSLKYYRNLGFKTFSPIIDESYDEEPDPDKRFLKIIKELNRLSSINFSEFEDQLLQLTPVLEHNAQVLKQFDAQTGDEVFKLLADNNNYTIDFCSGKIMDAT